MEPKMTPLEDLGARVARAQDRALDRGVNVRTKDRLLAASRAPKRSWLGWAIIAFAIAILTTFSVWIRPFEQELRCNLSTGASITVGEWVGAPPDAPITLRFSDGTALNLAPMSTARLVAVNESGARVVLERGAVDVSVVPLHNAHWYVDVGPFEVSVTGTRFRTAWNADTTQLDLELHEGSVVVRGPVLGDGRRMIAGETLRVSVADARMELKATSALAHHEEGPAASASVDHPQNDDASQLPPVVVEKPAALPNRALVQRTAPHASADAAPSESTTRASKSPSWQELARSGEYREALQRAEADGFAQVIEQATSGELLDLADAARFGGNVGRASEALNGLRRRYPNSSHGALAAFLLGRIAFDDQKAYAAAATWFSTYLAEQPGGSFAEAASGRLLEARSLSGDASGAREAARAYLKAHPSGPHADRARSLLQP